MTTAKPPEQKEPDYFVIGVQNGTQQDVVYLEPRELAVFWATDKELKQWRKENHIQDIRDIDLDELQEHPEKYQALIDKLAPKIKEAIAKTHPELKDKISNQEASILFIDAMTDGAFANKALQENGVCIINRPSKNQDGQGFAMFGYVSKFPHSYLKPIPITTEDNQIFIGGHEARHCDQSNGENSLENTFEHEGDADVKGIAALLKNGRTEAVQAIIDIRVLAAANGDIGHATSIFLEHPEDFKGATTEHLDAAQRFRGEMCAAVAQKLGIKEEEAEKLRLQDPQKFVKLLKSYIAEGGTFPADYNIEDEDELKKMVSKKLGMDPDAPISADRLNAFNEEYKKMKAAGEFRQKPTDSPNPHIQTYINQYIGAVERRFISDTTPEPQEKMERTPDLSASARMNEDRVREELIATMSGKSPEECSKLKETNPRAYWKYLDDALKRTPPIPIQSTFNIPEDKERALLAKELNIPVEQLDSHPAFLVQVAREKLEKAGALNYTVDNPQLRERLQESVNKYMPTSPPKQISLSGTNNSPRGFDIIKDGEVWTAKIDGISPSAYFNQMASSPPPFGEMLLQSPSSAASIERGQQRFPPHTALIIQQAYS